MSKLLTWALELLLAAWIVTIGGLSVAAQLAPEAGLRLVAVRTGSMAPAILPADLVAIEPVAPDRVETGDVITVGLDSGSMVTHRVIAVLDSGVGPTFVTRGDANPTADPKPVRPDQVRGRAAWRLPVAGVVLAMLSLPLGILALMSMGATLIVAIWVLDERRAQHDEDAIESELRKLRRLMPSGTRS